MVTQSTNNPIVSDLPPITPEPNPVIEAWHKKAEEAALERKNPVYEISHKAYVAKRREQRP
jgi:hypothetical protein